MKTTKEEMQKRIAVLERDNRVLENRDEDARRGFALAFEWFERTGHFAGDKPMLPTWTQIYIEIGRLLAARSFVDFEGKVSGLEVRVETLERRARDNHEGV